MNRSEAGRLGGNIGGAASKAARDRRKEDYELAPKKCKQCYNPLPFEKKKAIYCSRSCAAKFNNRASAAAWKPCPGCSRQIHPAKMYCSQICGNTHRFNLKIEAWRNGDTDLSLKIIRKTFEQKCSGCGLTDWLDKPLTLELDHIDGKADNNHPENLRMLCPNCHSQTPTFKAKNKGNGRRGPRK